MSHFETIISRLKVIEDKLDLLLTEKTEPKPETPSFTKNQTGKMILDFMKPGQLYSHYEIYKAVSASPDLRAPVTEKIISSGLSGLKNNNLVVMIRKGLYKLPEQTA